MFLSPLLAALAGCNTVVMNPSGDIAKQEADLIVVSVILMLLIIVPVMILIIWFARKYRASNTEAAYEPDWDHSTKLELVIWGAPLLIIIVLGLVTWISTHKLDPYRPLDRLSEGRPVPASAKPLVIEAVAMDWKWLFIYPEQGIATVNQLIVPTGVPVHFSLTSGSVMNSFWVPQLGGMVATMNRMATQLSLQADDAGDYYGESAQFSGDGFSEMHFLVHAVSADEFARWLGATRHSGAALDAASYAELARQSRNVQPFTYGSVQAGLFDAVVKQQIPPAGGPEAGHGGVGVDPRTGS